MIWNADGRLLRVLRGLMNDIRQHQRVSHYFTVNESGILLKKYLWDGNVNVENYVSSINYCVEKRRHHMPKGQTCLPKNMDMFDILLHLMRILNLFAMELCHLLGQLITLSIALYLTLRAGWWLKVTELFSHAQHCVFMKEIRPHLRICSEAFPELMHIPHLFQIFIKISLGKQYFMEKEFMTSIPLRRR